MPARSPARLAAAAVGTVGLLALSIGSLFVHPSARPPADTATERPVARPSFPAVSALPIRTAHPEGLKIAASLRMRRGDLDNLLSLELGVPEADAVAIASTQATVLSVRSNPRSKTTVVLRSSNGFVLEYSNLSGAMVKVGQAVGYGEPIGTAGRRSAASGSLLWYEVQTGPRYFEVIRMESRAPGAGAPWVLEIGPESQVSTRNLGWPALTLDPSVEDYWFPREGQ